MKEPQVIHVNDRNEVIGFLPKMEAHEKGLLHRAVSILIFNNKGEWLLQRRAEEKYHSGGLWTNTACSHPYPYETEQLAAERRLMEEMGMEANLREVFNFKYFAKLDNNLTEHEIDHVFVGYTDEAPRLNQDEACDWKYVSEEALEKDIEQNPQNYTEWFKILFPKVVNELNQLQKAS